MAPKPRPRSHVMSSLFLHVGQCGNQIGQAFWNDVEEWYEAKPLEQIPSRRTTLGGRGMKPARTDHVIHVPFSFLDGTLPCVLVDTEPKVVKSCCKGGALAKRVPPTSQLVEKSGRGNNWAYGYYGKSSHGQSRDSCLKDSVQECVRNVVERCDCFMGTVLFHSIAGGTGSGLGSFILEQLRDDYPLAYIFSVAVAPFSLGETPLQHYNTLLCLSWQQTYSDAVLLFQNDYVLEQAQKSTRAEKGAGRHSSEDVSVGEMNRHISQTLCNSFLPIWSAKQKSANLSYMEPWELLRSLCPDPSLKFITPTHTQFCKPNNTWDQAVSCVTHPSTLRRKYPTQGKASCISLVPVARSSPSNIESLIANVGNIEKKMKQAYTPVPWNPFPVDFWFSHEPQLASKKLMTVLANSSAISDYVSSVLERATMMYKERAYLHWYEKYGCTHEVFKEGFETVHSICTNYECIV